ncbi:MAG: wax ester/triacylglycerol synthase family O-acyltransferase [Rhodocyclaceae bacterium]
MSRTERISPVDTAWLRMDRPANRMMIVGVMMFDDAIRLEDLRRVVRSRLLPLRRFRQRAALEISGAYWVEDEDFDLDFHVKAVALPRPAGSRELQGLVADLVATPLDATRPLWQFLLVENYDGGSAVVARIHHCIADGIALMGVLLSMTDDSPDAREAPLEAEPEADETSQAEPWLLAPATQAMLAAIRMSGTLWSKYWSLVANPGQAFDLARMMAAIGAELAHLATLPDDSATRFKGRPGTVKRVSWSEPMPLAEIKAIGKALGCSVNDLLLSTVAGALRGYLAGKGDAVEGVEIRAMVPVNLRDPRDAVSLGNRFGLVEVVLPVGLANPLERLYEVKRRMEGKKSSLQAPVVFGLLSALGLMPRAVQQQVLDILARKATAVMTNVPGPQKPLWLAGARLRQLMFWVPQSGDIGMGVSILSYDGGVQLGLITDHALVPDPEKITALFQPEFERLLYQVLMEPWSDEAKQAPEAAPARRARRAKRAIRKSRKPPTPND